MADFRGNEDLRNTTVPGILKNSNIDKVTAEFQDMHLGVPSAVLGVTPSGCSPTVRFDLDPQSVDGDAKVDGIASSSSIPILDHIADKLKDLNLSGRITAVESKASERGGYADVYRGTLEVMQDGIKKEVPVAVKRLRGKIDDMSAAKSIAREIRIWSEFEHANVLKLEGFFMEGLFPALVSKWMQDGSLQQYMKAQDMTRREAISIVSDIAQGLAYMHPNGAIHSDVKSDNILISPARRALLTDFGISRMEALTNGYTMTERSRGNVRWHAVEYLNISDESSPPLHTKPTDVWAFGMTVYEILTNDRPYAHLKDDIHVLMQLMAGKYPPKPALSEIPNDVLIEEFMWSLCLKCRITDPNLRPPMAELEAAIGRKIADIDEET